MTQPRFRWRAPTGRFHAHNATSLLRRHPASGELSSHPLPGSARPATKMFMGRSSRWTGNSRIAAGVTASGPGNQPPLTTIPSLLSSSRAHIARSHASDATRPAASRTAYAALFTNPRRANARLVTETFTEGSSQRARSLQSATGATSRCAGNPPLLTTIPNLHSNSTVLTAMCVAHSATRSQRRWQEGWWSFTSPRRTRAPHVMGPTLQEVLHAESYDRP